MENKKNKMSASSTAKSTYRAILREIPRRSLSSPTPLHNRVRDSFRKQVTNESLTSEKISEEAQRKIHEAEQFALYAKAQREYVRLVDRYNPGSWMDEEDRIRLTARRVGLDLPELHEEGKEKESA